MKLEDQIKMNVKASNGKIARAMTMDDIRDTDLFVFLEKVRKLCEEEAKKP